MAAAASVIVAVVWSLAQRDSFQQPIAPAPVAPARVAQQPPESVSPEPTVVTHPTLWAYRQAAAQSPEALDALLDDHASRLLPGSSGNSSGAMTLPPDDAQQAEKRLSTDPRLEDQAGKMALAILPTFAPARRHEAVHETRLAMLRAAIAVRLSGFDALSAEAHRDPYGTGPFTYAKTERGFVLRSTLVDPRGKPVELTVGR